MSGPGTVEIHRPGRLITTASTPTSIRIEPPPPSSVDSAADGWALLSPVLSSLGGVAFAVMIGGRRYLTVAAVMATLAIGAALVTRRARTRAADRHHQAARTRYQRHLNHVEQRLMEAATNQRKRATQDHPNADCLEGIVVDRTRVWERLTHHPDFAVVRIGSISTRPDLYPSGSTRWDDGAADPELLDLARQLERRWATVDGLPITIDLRAITCLTIIGDRPVGLDLARSIITRLAVLQSPEDLSFTIRTDGPADRWDWVKWLPHVHVEQRDHQKQVRPNSVTSAEPPRLPNRVMVVDGYQPGSERSDDVDSLLETDCAPDTVVIALVEHPDQTPTSADAIVVVTDGVALFTRLDGSTEVVRDITIDRIDQKTAEQIARSLAPLRTRPRRHHLDSAPCSLLTLLELGLPKPDITGHRASTPPGCSPIGTDVSGRALWLDLREAAAGGIGPHGLLVGATGSGKSELLRTLVTGLALGASSDDLTFLFIDFKGGATFAGLDRLPHTTGVVTNLESSQLLVDRMRLAVEYELLHRQTLLRRTGTDGVAGYRELRRLDPTLEPLPDLLIVVDEFAELLSAHPLLEDTFASLGRTGRSLGVRLLLSSQRIDEGRLRRLEAHLRYRICLKTFTPEESMAAVGSRASFDLPAEPGHGHLAVDGSLVRFRTALVHPATEPSAEATIPNGFEVVDIDRPPGRDPRRPVREMTDVLVDRIARLERPTRRIWFDPLPDLLTLPELASDRHLRAVIGMTDRPANREQAPAEIDFTEGSGHLAIVGMPGSGASTLIATLICSLAAGHAPDDVALHVADHGGGVHDRLRALPHVKSMFDRGDVGGVRVLVEDLITRIEKTARSDSWEESVFLVIDGWDSFIREYGAEVADQVATIAAEGSRSGIHLVISANRWTDFGHALRGLLTLKFELRLNQPLESEIDRRAAEMVPRHMPGRGIDASGHLTQVALPLHDLSSICRKVGKVPLRIAPMSTTTASISTPPRP